MNMPVTPQIIDGSLQEVRDRLNALPDVGQRAHVVLWVEPANGKQSDTAMPEAKEQEAIAYLQERLRAALTDPEAIRKAEEELAELHRNLNRNRLDADERPLFPE